MLWTVYGLHEFGKLDEIQYVGLTRQAAAKRLAGHLSAYKNPLWYGDRLRPVNEWVLRLIRSRIQIQIRSLTQTEDEAFARQMEREMIAWFSARGPLLNVTDNPQRKAATNAAKRVFFCCLTDEAFPVV